MAWQAGSSGASANSVASARYSEERLTRWTRRSRSRRTPRRIQSIAACRWVSSERSGESPGAEPARQLRPLAPQQGELALADLALGQPRVRGDRDQRLEHQRLALRVGAQLRDLGADRVGVLAELAPEAAQVVGDLALVVGERGLVDRLRRGHRGRQLAHELRRAGAQALELRLQLGEGALQRCSGPARGAAPRPPAHRTAPGSRARRLASRLPTASTMPARSSKNCSTRSPSAVTS